MSTTSASCFRIFLLLLSLIELMGFDWANKGLFLSQEVEAAQSITISPATLPPPSLDANYSQLLTQTGGSGSVTWSISEGKLPNGLTLFSTGTLSGSPSATGTFDFTVKAVDAGGLTGTRSYTLVINCLPYTITPAELSPVRVGQQYLQLFRIGFTSSFGPASTTAAKQAFIPPPDATFNYQLIGQLPSGLSFAANIPFSPFLRATAIMGVPKESGTFNFTIRATPIGNSDDSCVGSRNYTLVVQDPSPVGDQNTGSVLVFNLYSSGTDPARQNTRINITNSHATLPAIVHLFFVAEGCAVADNYLCLTPNQTTSFLMSDFDPGVTGYLMAVATDALGCPTSFNYLVGDEYVKLASGHAANLGAVAFSQVADAPPFCDPNSGFAQINFDGVSYSRAPATLALPSLGSRADGNNTLLVLNRLGGDLVTGAATLGTIFGILYDDTENAASFSLVGGCQLRGSISNDFPRTTPRFEGFVKAGRTGWMRLYSFNNFAILGAAINYSPGANTSAEAFSQGHNLHVLTLARTASYVIPVFPPGC